MIYNITAKVVYSIEAASAKEALDVFAAECPYDIGDDNVQIECECMGE